MKSEFVFLNIIFILLVTQYTKHGNTLQKPGGCSVYRVTNKMKMIFKTQTVILRIQSALNNVTGKRSVSRSCCAGGCLHTGNHQNRRLIVLTRCNVEGNDFLYTRWNSVSREPNDINNRCVLMDPASRYMWADSGCTQRHAFVCRQGTQRPAFCHTLH